MNPARDVSALASIEVDISGIEVGAEKTVKWRGKPIFIKRRTAKEISDAQDVDLNELKDPQKDSDRVKAGKEEWLITVGICTHLGCVPMGGAGEFKGWFCPCHGSVYDTSARIRKGPAPKNLEVPPYEFVSDTIIKIG
jgi:ubiquinol-cytochrome c reductase iron-sulfur subunit